MSFVVYDRVTDVSLAVVGDIGVAQCVSRLYEDMGYVPSIRMHDAVECVSLDDDLAPIFCFEI